jgi:predicted transcriptional regulator
MNIREFVIDLTAADLRHHGIDPGRLDDELAEAREREIDRILDGHEKAMAMLEDVLEESGMPQPIARAVTFLYRQSWPNNGPEWLAEKHALRSGTEEAVGNWVDEQRRKAINY